ncbi:C-type lectin 1-like [Homarus americanus]|uniref:C-type lectin-like 40 n=1 Tax=Homarus americanus TaxID=6706 RepID=A0A8J5ML71_HOMAM|nr:C-type lectin 1-like [Homarus americanus]KAG7155494.1 C-type lectin-like 40 [Homarus americanus]
MAVVIHVLDLFLLVSSAMPIPFPSSSGVNMEEMSLTLKRMQQSLSQQAWALYQMLDLSRKYHICAQEPCCPPPFARVIDECFYLSLNNLTWQQARQHCRGMDGLLAKPKRVFALKSFLMGKAGPNTVFLGGQQHDGIWTWVDGSSINPSAWTEGYPSNWTTQENQCIVMKQDNHPPLSTQPCSAVKQFICQHPGIQEKVKTSG